MSVVDEISGEEYSKLRFQDKLEKLDRLGNEMRLNGTSLYMLLKLVLLLIIALRQRDGNAQ